MKIPHKRILDISAKKLLFKRDVYKFYFNVVSDDFSDPNNRIYGRLMVYRNDEYKNHSMIKTRFRLMYDFEKKIFFKANAPSIRVELQNEQQVKEAIEKLIKKYLIGT